MKVFDLTCRHGHRFEGWFASSEAFASQSEASEVHCPMCDSVEVERAPSAPRLNLGSGTQSGAPAGNAIDGTPAPQRTAAEVLDTLRQLMAAVENVGPRFAEEARRIHYEEAPARAIRGTATDRERLELQDEGIDTLTIALPLALTGTLQ